MNCAAKQRSPGAGEGSTCLTLFPKELGAMGIAAIGKVFETMSFGEDAGGNTGKYWVLFVFGVCFFLEGAV